MSAQVQSLRGVGSKRGYSYYAFGVYVPGYSRRTKRVTYRLVKSGPWVRSDVHGPDRVRRHPSRRRRPPRHARPGPDRAGNFPLSRNAGDSPPRPRDLTYSC